MSTQPATPFDDVFKDAVDREPEALLALLGITLTGPPAPLPTELRVSLRADYAAIAPICTGQTIFLIEFERNPGRETGLRMLGYAGAHAPHGLPIVSILVVASDGPRRKISEVVALGALRLELKILRLRDCVGLESNPALAELALLSVPKRDRERTLQAAAETLVDAHRTDQLGNLLLLARTLGVNRSTLRKLEHRMSVLLRQARSEGREEGLEQGLEQGLERGLGQGLVRGRGQALALALRATGMVVGPERVLSLGVLSDDEAMTLLRVRLRDPTSGLDDLVGALSANPPKAPSPRSE